MVIVFYGMNFSLHDSNSFSLVIVFYGMNFSLYCCYSFSLAISFDGMKFSLCFCDHFSLAIILQFYVISKEVLDIHEKQLRWWGGWLERQCLLNGVMWRLLSVKNRVYSYVNHCSETLVYLLWFILLIEFIYMHNQNVLF